jgi:hypothetical protein
VTRRVLLTAILIAGVWQVPGVALADGGDDGQVVVDTSAHQVQLFSLILGVILPLIVALVTTRVTSPSTKAWLLAGLSAVTGFLTEYAHSIGSGSFDWMAALIAWLGTFLVAVGTYYGLWQHTAVQSKLQDVGSKKT